MNHEKYLKRVFQSHFALFARLFALDLYITCVAGAERGGEGEKRESGEKERELFPQSPSLFDSSLSPTPFDACYAG